jgi:argininosuccinate lyase
MTSTAKHQPNTDAVSLRERVKAPPAKALVEAYYGPAIANGIKFLFAHEMRIHLAHVLMLADRNIIARAHAASILAALLDLQAKGPAILDIDYGQEDLYSYVERHIVRVLGPDVGGRMHTARSRNDLNITTWRLALRERLLAVLGDLAVLRTTVLRLAAEHRSSVMPGYTHTQHAQPISLGYYLLAYADVLARDAQRLRGALGHCDVCPLGAGALSTTAFPIDRAGVAAALGFANVMEVAYDCVSSRDDIHEAVSAAAILMTGISRVATDLQTWNTAEFGFIELADQFSSVSSIMPQKKNPQALEYAKSAAAHVTGALTTVLACSKNTSFGDVNDGVTAPNVPALEALDRTRQTLVVLEGVLSTMSVRPEAMRHAAAIGFGTATELADVIVRETDLSFRKAHNIVGRIVRETIEAGKTAMDMTSADLDRAALVLFGQKLGISAGAVRIALDPTANIAARSVTGGPAPDAVAAMVSAREADLTTEIAALDTRSSGIAHAGASLQERARDAAA